MLTLYVFFTWSFPPDQLQSALVLRKPMSKSKCLRQTWSTLLLFCLIQKKIRSCTLGSLCNGHTRMVNGYGQQKICCKVSSCSGLHHYFRHSLRDWYWCSCFWRRVQRTLDANLVEKPIEGAGVRYQMGKQEWTWWHKIQPLNDLKSDSGITLQTDCTACITPLWALRVAKLREK